LVEKCVSNSGGFRECAGCKGDLQQKYYCTSLTACLFFFISETGPSQVDRENAQEKQA
jgi:hypothetical protein